MDSDWIALGAVFALALVPLLSGQVARRGEVTAHVRRNRTCDHPTADPTVFAAQISAVTLLK
jgi:hypothetical protein